MHRLSEKLAQKLRLTVRVQILMPTHEELEIRANARNKAMRTARDGMT